MRQREQSICEFRRQDSALYLWHTKFLFIESFERIVRREFSITYLESVSLVLFAPPPGINVIDNKQLIKIYRLTENAGCVCF